MKLLFRLIWLILTQSRRSRTSIMGPVDTQVRVYPNDLDVFLHVNNGVYLTYADLGRTDLLLRANAFRPLMKRGWYPVIASETIQFRKSLKLGQKVTITTHVLGWDELSIYMEQTFTHKDELIARMMLDAKFLARSGGRVSNTQLFEVLNIQRGSPPLPEYLTRWIASDRTKRL